MKLLEKGLFGLGFLLLIIAAINKLIGRPHIASGVRLISLIILANTAFLLSIILKLREKK